MPFILDMRLLPPRDGALLIFLLMFVDASAPAGFLERH